MYLGQIGAMLTAPFIQSKSAFASLTALEPPLLFNHRRHHLYLYNTWQCALLCYRATGVT